MIIETMIKRIANLDPMMSNPARMMIIYLLYPQGKQDYLTLMRTTGLSSGNITTHLGKLASCGYIKITKSFKGNKPHTAIELSSKGKKAYLDWAEQILAVLPEQAISRYRQSQIQEYNDLLRYNLILKDWQPLSNAAERFQNSAWHNLNRIPWPPVEELWTL